MQFYSELHDGAVEVGPAYSIIDRACKRSFRISRPDGRRLYDHIRFNGNDLSRGGLHAAWIAIKSLDDKRTDIWAFGCVLYELLTGKQAFAGETLTDIIAKILQSEPEWKALPPATPGKISDLLRRCVQKDQTLRFRDAGGARIEIQEALSAPAEPVVAAPIRPIPIWRRPLPLSIAGLSALTLAVIVSIATWNLKPTVTSARPITRTVINLPPGDQLAALDYPSIAISPDGRQLAYVAMNAGTRQIFLRALDSLEAKSLSGTEGAAAPFFSPDGQWLGFFAGGRLKKISTSGGPAQTLANATNALGASWGSQGRIIFSRDTASAIQQVSDAGGDQQPLTHLEKGEAAHISPELLPGGKCCALRYGSAQGGDCCPIAQHGRTTKLGSGWASRNDPGICGGAYLSSLRCFRAPGLHARPKLMAVPFDIQRLQVTGAAVPVVEGILGSPLTALGANQYSICAVGSLVYVPGFAQAAERLVWVSRNGKEQALAVPLHIYANLRVSPDGRRIAVTIAEQENQIYLL